MTMMSFRVETAEARKVARWAKRLRIDRSELLRQALRKHLESLANEQDAATWEAQPLDAGERSLAEIADWGPAEEWADWADEAG